MNKKELAIKLDKAFGKEELAELKDIKFKVKELIESQKQLSEESKNDVLSWITDINIALKVIANKEYPKTEIPPFPKIPEFPEKKLDDIKKAIENIKQPLIKTEKVEFPDNLKELNQKELSALLRELSEGDIQKLTDIVSAINRLGVRDNPIFVKVLDKKGNIIASNARGGIATSSSPPAYHTGVKDANGNEAYLNLNAQGQLEVDANFTGAATEVTLAKIAPLGHYKSNRLDKDDATYYYFGSEDKDGNWLIERMNKTTNDSIFALGIGGISTVWSDRATQSYGEYNTKF